MNSSGINELTCMFFRLGYGIAFLQQTKVSVRKSITKTYLYSFDPLKTHFYIGKLRFTRVYIIFLISAQKYRLFSIYLNRRVFVMVYPENTITTTHSPPDSPRRGDEE